jgi:hypothetical protein
MYRQAKTWAITSIIFVSMMTGCVRQTLPNEFDLQEEDGIVFFTASCEYGVESFYIYPSGFNPNFFTDIAASAKIQFCPSSPELRSYSISAGKHFIGNLYAVGDSYEFPEEEAFVFTVSPGAITYIGDIRIFTKTVRKGPSSAIYFDIGITDLEYQTLPDTREKHPKLFDKYEYIKRLAEKE